MFKVPLLTILIFSIVVALSFASGPEGHASFPGGDRDGIPRPADVTDLLPFALISPTDDDTIDTCYPYCIWTPTIDPDLEYPTSYLVYISSLPDFPDPILSDTLSDTTWSCPLCLPYGIEYFWKVTAFNGHSLERQSDQIFNFTVYTPTCQYIPGDINGNGSANGIDVTFGVSYFKGNPGTVPPDTCFACPTVGQDLMAAGDVNGNCQFNGIDVTFFVGYLKGIQPVILFCPNCPPSSR